MKHSRGSALVLVMCITGALSILMLRIYYRASLLLQTVVERERDIKMHCATEALMLYAVHMAKHNWSYLIKLAKQGKESLHSFAWEIDEKRKGAAMCVFKGGRDELLVEVSLQCDMRTMKITCILKSVQASIMIDQWKEG